MPWFFADSSKIPDCGEVRAIAGDSVELTTHCYSRSMIPLRRRQMLVATLPRIELYT